MATKHDNLSCISALVTRPEPSGESLIQCIRQCGGKSCSLPMLDIIPNVASRQHKQLLESLGQFDLIIVTSHNAARFGMAWIKQQVSSLPEHCQWYAIGRRTARELSVSAIQPLSIIVPSSGHNSEALLAMENLQSIKEQRILLLKGEGGRPLLEDALRERGALVTSLAVYRRCCPRYDREETLQLLEKQCINAILCHSGETVISLRHNLTAQWFQDCPLIVPGQRVAKIATSLGSRKVFIATSPDDRAMLSALFSCQAACFN
ncbi:Uroporphyrinogen-III synthase [invertebrate metagenome]|uniref:uroporphyrinogen-III synthase n=1 Tax=invertebrate metagenome TaxID=1711999 RepID=A0A2H9TBW9_9ZZZZ